jgi:hypothetical protein
MIGRGAHARSCKITSSFVNIVVPIVCNNHDNFLVLLRYLPIMVITHVAYERKSLHREVIP